MSNYARNGYTLSKLDRPVQLGSFNTNILKENGKPGRKQDRNLVAKCCGVFELPVSWLQHRKTKSDPGVAGTELLYALEHRVELDTRVIERKTMLPIQQHCPIVAFNLGSRVCSRHR